MFQNSSERHVHAFLQAARRAIDPARSVLADSSPYLIGATSGAASRKTLVAGSIAAHRTDSDYIHLEFAPGAEEEGPFNVKVGMIRFTAVNLRETCRFWMGEDGEMALVAECGPKHATMTFDPEGMDSRPGLPAGDLEAGYARAAARLRALAASELAANDFRAKVTFSAA